MRKAKDKNYAQHFAVKRKRRAYAALYSLEFLDYRKRVVAAGGGVTHFKQVNEHIVELVKLGGAYWNTMGTACRFIGVNLAGCFVPLREGMNVPTGHGWNSAALNSILGLKGNGIDMYIDANRAVNDDHQDSHSHSVYLTDRGSLTSNGTWALLGGGGGNIGSSQLTLNVTAGLEEVVFRNRTGSGDSPGATSDGGSLGFAGSSRSNSSEYVARHSSGDYVVSRNAQTPQSVNFLVYARNSNTGSPGLHSPARMSGYNIGPNLVMLPLAQEMRRFAVSINYALDAVLPAED